MVYDMNTSWNREDGEEWISHGENKWMKGESGSDETQLSGAKRNVEGDRQKVG